MREIRARLPQDRVRPPQLPVLLLQLGDPLRVVAGRSRRLTRVDPGLLDPVPQRVRIDPELLTDQTSSPGHRHPRSVRELVTDQPSGTLPHLVGGTSSRLAWPASFRWIRPSINPGSIHIATAAVTSGWLMCHVSTSGPAEVAETDLAMCRAGLPGQGVHRAGRAGRATKGAARDTGVLVGDRPDPPRARPDRRGRPPARHDLEHGLGRPPAAARGDGQRPVPVGSQLALRVSERDALPELRPARRNCHGGERQLDYPSIQPHRRDGRLRRRGRGRS